MALGLPIRRVVALACCALSACGDPIAPPSDATITRDGVVFDSGNSDDFDGDGLCNETEALEGTDPYSADTDGDGFPDAAEVQLGFSPVRNASPTRDVVYILREGEAGAVQVPLERTVYGVGEDFVGAFEAIGLPDEAGQSASTFFREAVTAYAVPASNVALIEPDEPTFRAVEGRTLLGFELRFAYGTNVTRACTRAYQFRFSVKRSDGALVSITTGTLLVLPNGSGNLRANEWCAPSGCF